METVSVLQGDLTTLHLTSLNHTPSLEGSLSDNTGFRVWDLDDSVVPPYSHVTSPHGTHFLTCQLGHSHAYGCWEDKT